MRSLAEYRAILKKKGFRYSFQEAWRKIQRFHYLSDPDILNSQWAYKVHKSLSKRYLHFWHDYDRVCDLYDKYPDKIWTCWLQGEEQAPPIVKKCLASIRRHSGGREVIVITEKNMWQYVSFPDYILKKKEKGIITNTHFSDILRIYLLALNGGIWMDATTYMTGDLPDYIANSPLFCYKIHPGNTGIIKMSSWFIVAKRNHELIVRTQQMLEDYWERHNHLCHYFLFHMLFSIACDESFPRMARHWRSIPYFNTAIPHTLLSELPEPYTPERWEQIKALSPVHKLTWKISPEHLTRPGTFLQWILNDQDKGAG